ncbi:uncharacterized protein CBL_08271 [Carabus blaptoides fortunei]
MDKLFIYLALIVQVTFANKLPAYFHRCTVSDPKFNACVLESANKALGPILKGDPSIGFPQLKPVQLPNFDFDLTENVNFKLTKGHGKVSEDFMFTEVIFDFDQKSAYVAGKASKLEWFVDYESSGKLAGKPFHEKGKAIITFDNLSWNSTVALGFKMVDGKKYVEALSGDTTTISKKFEFKPSDQVNLDAPMTDEQIREYQTYFRTIGLAIRKEAQSLGTQFTLLELNLIFKTQPFDEIFLP